MSVPVVRFDEVHRWFSAQHVLKGLRTASPGFNERTPDPVSTISPTNS